MLEYKRHYTLADFRGTGTIEKVTAVLVGEFEKLGDLRFANLSLCGAGSVSFVS